MDGERLHAFAIELLHEPVGAALGAHEHRVRSLPSAIAAATFTLSIWWTSEEAVVHLVDGGLVLARPRARPGRACSGRRGGHRAVERRREQHRLVRRVDAVEDLLHLRHEAHVGHAVGLVDDEHLDRRRATAPRARCRSMRRPGVPTTTSTPFWSAVICGSIDDAAVDGPHLAVADLAERASASVTWVASSRVGTRTRAAGGAARPCRCARGAGGRRRGSCPSRSWPCPARRARRGRRRW